MLGRLAISWLTSTALLIVMTTSVFAAGLSHVRLRGTLQTTARGEEQALSANQFNRGDTTYDYLIFRLHLEAAPSDRLQIISQIMYNDSFSKDFALYGAYFLYEALEQGRLYFEAGKIPSPFGTFAARSYPDKNPLIGIPLMYYYHSPLLRRTIPSSADDLLAVYGQGQDGLNGYPAGLGSQPFTSRGLPIIYDACWDLGSVLLGAKSPFEYRFGVVLGAPGGPESNNVDSNDNRTVIGRFGLAPSAGIRLGISGARGSYLANSLDPVLPTNSVAEDYKQTVIGCDFEASRDRWIVRSEAALNSIESPFISENLNSKSWYAEFETKPWAGSGFAARWDELIYGQIKGSDGMDHHWAESIRRLEIGSYYWITADLVVKANVQWNSLGAGSFGPGDPLESLQVVARF